MSQQFVDREEELGFLEERWRSGSPELIVIYGRRRVGKTELLLRFSRDKPHVYFLCDKTSVKDNLRRMAARMARYLGRKSFAKIAFDDWTSLFSEFLEWKGGERVAVIVDEFPYLVELDRSTPSQFQVIWDELLSRRGDVMLILCGSSVGVMETEVLGYRSPLYGRRTGQWRVGELRPWDVAGFVPGYPAEDVARVYGMLGGVPAYLSMLRPDRGFWWNMGFLLFRKGSPLYEEAENLLRQELREPRNYRLILQALAEGATRIVDIANSTGLDKAQVSRYIDTLEMMGLVSHEAPLLGKPKTKKRRYRISDNYFRFWFRYVQPNKDLVEEGGADELVSQVKETYDTYMGPVLEDIARKAVLKGLILPFKPTRVGRHWWRTRGEEREVDILAIGRGFHALIEVKWSSLSQADVKRIASKLQTLSQDLNLPGKTILAIVARKTPKTSPTENIIVKSLKDIIPTHQPPPKTKNKTTPKTNNPP